MIYFSGYPVTRYSPPFGEVYGSVTYIIGKKNFYNKGHVGI